MMITNSNKTSKFSDHVYFLLNLRFIQLPDS